MTITSCDGYVCLNFKTFSFLCARPTNMLKMFMKKYKINLAIVHIYNINFWAQSEHCFLIIYQNINFWYINHQKI